MFVVCGVLKIFNFTIQLLNFTGCMGFCVMAQKSKMCFLLIFGMDANDLF